MPTSNEKAEMNVANSQDVNQQVVKMFSDGSTMMTFANGSMKVPNFVITDVKSLAPASTIQNSVPETKVQNIIPKQNITSGIIVQNAGRFIKVSKCSPVNKVPVSFIKQENVASSSQDASQWMNSPIKRFVAKRKILPGITSSLTNVQNLDEDHAYVTKHQVPIITMKKIIPQSPARTPKITDRVCRLCLKSKESLTPLFCGNLAKPELRYFLKECCSLEVAQNDPMPKSVCNECKLKLLAAWDFRNQCQKSDTELRKYYKLPLINDSASQTVLQKDKGVQVECYDRSKRITVLRSIKQEIIEENEALTDNLNTEVLDTTDNYSKEDDNNDENSVSYFLESFAQEIGNDINKSDNDGFKEDNEANEEVSEIESENQTPIKKEVTEKRMVTRRRRKLKEKGKFLCHMCPRVFTTKGFLERHANLHLTEKMFTCSTCDKVFKTEEKLTVHMRIHDTTKRFECDVCGLKYAYEHLLNSHLRLHGKGKPLSTEKNFLCEICSKSFVSQSGLKHHQKLHMNLKPYKCKFCEKTFTMPIYRKKHEVRHTDDRQFKCHICPATYASTNGLTNHLLMHTGEAHYHCDTCGKSFRRRKYLNEHIHTHTGEKPYICKMCGIGYGNSGSLFAHQKRCKIHFHDELTEPVIEEVVTDMKDVFLTEN